MLIEVNKFFPIEPVISNILYYHFAGLGFIFSYYPHGH